MAKIDFIKNSIKKVESAYKKIIAKIVNSRNIHSNRIKIAHKKIINLSITLLSIFSFITLFIGFIEYNGGNYPIYEKVRVGAICYDGWRSYSIGSGTCSHHGGVKEWLYKDVKVGMHYSNHIMYFDLCKASFLILLIPAFFHRYYAFTLIFYSINTLTILIEGAFAIISLPIIIILTPVYGILSLIYSIYKNRGNNDKR